MYTQLSGHGLGGLDTRILLPKGRPHQIVIDCLWRSWAERSEATAADGGFSGSGGSVYVYDMMAVLLMPKKTGKLSALFFGLSLKPVSCGRAS